MKKYFVFIAFVLSFNMLKAQIDLGISWQKNIFPMQITSARIAQDGNFAFVTAEWVPTGDPKAIVKMSLQTGEISSTFENKLYKSTGSFNIIASTMNDTHLVTQEGKVVCFWDIAQERAIKSFTFDSSQGIKSEILNLAISKDEKFTAIAYYDENLKGFFVKIYDINNNKEIIEFPIFENGRFPSISFSNNGNILALGYTYVSLPNTVPITKYQVLNLIDTKTWQVTKEIDRFNDVSFTEQFLSIGFSPNDSLVYYNPNTQSNTKMKNIYTNNNIYYDILHSAFIYSVFPNSMNYLVGKGRLELFENSKKINTFNINPQVIDSRKINGKMKVFAFGNDEISLLNEVPFSDVKENVTIKINIIYDIQNNLLKLQNNLELIQKFTLIDLKGKILLNQFNITNNIIYVNLNTGMYNCIYKINGIDYSQNIQVVR